MKGKWAVIAVVLLAALAAGQAPEQYLDVFVVQVKPEKRADFDVITRKMAEMNRQNKGDTWLAMETAYGPGERVTFVSQRQGYADIEKSSDAFMGALAKSLGKTGTEKLLADFQQCVLSTRSEFRRRRWDLSSNPPADPAAMAKLIGEARYLRTVTVHVRPGQVGAFEDELKQVKAAREKASPPLTTLVSEAVAGQEGSVYYVTVPENSLAAFDNFTPLAKALGEEDYQKFLKVSADAVASTETVINRFLPRLSNAPEEIAAIAPDYWHPKAVVAAKAAKPKSPVSNASEANKVPEEKKQ
jgi:hypothetical protein